MKKRVFAFIMSVFFMFSVSTISYAAEDGDFTQKGDKIELYTINLETGEQSTEMIDISHEKADLNASSYIPEDRPQIEPYKVIGSDGRVRVIDILMGNIPYSCLGVVIAEFSDGSSQYGTGCLFGPNDVVTAAHIFRKDNGSFAQSISFTPGVNGDYDSHTHYTGRNLSIPEGYIESQYKVDDWATFTLSSNVGDSVGYLGWTTESFAGMGAQITGYPDDKPNFEMWLAGGYIDSAVLSYMRNN